MLTLKPRLFSRQPSEAAVIPFLQETTPRDKNILGRHLSLLLYQFLLFCPGIRAKASKASRMFLPPAVLSVLVVAGGRFLPGQRRRFVPQGCQQGKNLQQLPEARLRSAHPGGKGRIQNIPINRNVQGTFSFKFWKNMSF